MKVVLSNLLIFSIFLRAACSFLHCSLQLASQASSLRTRLKRNIIILFLKRWFAGKKWKSRWHLKTCDLLNWTKCLRNECYVEKKGSILQWELYLLLKNQRSKVKRWIHRSCPSLIIILWFSKRFRASDLCIISSKQRALNGKTNFLFIESSDRPKFWLP